LVPDREDTYFVGGDDKPVKRDVSGVAVGDDQFAQLPFDSTAYQRMCDEIVDRRLDCGHGILRSSGILVAQKKKCAFDVTERAR
jgi:hypothetical protein